VRARGAMVTSWESASIVALSWCNQSPTTAHGFLCVGGLFDQMRQSLTKSTISYRAEHGRGMLHWPCAVSGQHAAACYSFYHFGENAQHGVLPFCSLLPVKDGGAWLRDMCYFGVGFIEASHVYLSGELDSLTLAETAQACGKLRGNDSCAACLLGVLEALMFIGAVGPSQYGLNICASLEMVSCSPVNITSCLYLLMSNNESVRTQEVAVTSLPHRWLRHRHSIS